MNKSSIRTEVEEEMKMFKKEEGKKVNGSDVKYMYDWKMISCAIKSLDRISSHSVRH